MENRDRLPPQNIEAEQGVLGSVLLDNDMLHEVVPLVKAEDFYRDTHQVLYRAIRALYDLGKPVDMISLSDELSRRGQLKAVGGTEALAEILGRVPHAANARYYAQIVRQKSISRDLIECANRMLRDGYSNDYTSEQLVDRAVSGLLDIQAAGLCSELTTVREEAPKVLEDFHRRQQGEVTGIGTGFPDLDQQLGGLQAEQLLILAARPSMGKSALAANICDHVAVECRLPVLFISLEMSRGSLAERLIVARARICSHKARSGFLNQHELDRAAEATRQLREVDIILADRPSMTAIQVIAAARGVALRHRIGLVILDYLQLVEGEEGRDSRQEQVSKISRSLKGLARDLKVPVLALSQLNRNLESREDRRPRMADLRESGSLEQDADVVLLLHRPEYYDANDRPNEADLILAKNRNGPTGTQKLTFLKQAMRFESYAPPVTTGNAPYF